MAPKLKGIQRTIEDATKIVSVERMELLAATCISLILLAERKGLANEAYILLQGEAGDIFYEH